MQVSQGNEEGSERKCSEGKQEKGKKGSGGVNSEGDGRGRGCG